VSLTTQVTGTLPVANGGTGNTTAQAEMNRVAQAVTSGQYLRGNGTNVLMSAIQAADVPTLNQNTTGSAATLTTARTIGGVSFNGSANINLPGVNIAGNQNTSGNAATATALSSGQSNWVGTGVLGNVVGLMAWKEYGNAHVIFDASDSTTPSGGACNNTNAAVAWSSTYPTLMGWNGSSTYGVRVDSARISDSTSGNAATVTSITSSQVTTALGFTPYNSTNPSAFINQAGARTALSFTAGSGAYNNSTGVITIPTNTNQLTNGAGYTTNTGTVTSVSGTGTASGLSLSGTVTTSGNITLSGTVNSLAAGTYAISISGNAATSSSTSGNAATATTLQTARTINGVSFNGSANITVTANTTNTLTLGTGLTGSSFNGSGAVTATVSYGTTAGTACQGNDSRLSDARQATNTNTQLASLGVGTAASGTAGEIRATNNVIAFYSSDIKFKENVRDIPNAAATAKAIGGKLFDWTDAYLADHGGADDYFVQKHDFGVIAQDVQKVFPIAVRTRPDGSLAVDYEKLSALALAAIAEQENRIAKLEALVAKLIEG